ncbi:MAG: NlpC/P60 family protein [Muribaculum sp.]|nr:NlpC/P60 family protein [Muribaculum sp.]
MFRYIATLILGIVFTVPALPLSLKKQKSEPSAPVVDHSIAVPEKESLHLAYVNAWKPTLPTLGGPVVDDEQPAYIADMISHAKEFMGLRYRRGGKTPKGFDCSGFTGYLFNQFGMKLNASSRSQFLQGDAVDDDSLRPGDLVFFSGRRGGTMTVGHVGMIVEIHGDGTFSFIHSANSSGITISHSLEPYYKSRYVGARRVTE